MKKTIIVCNNCGAPINKLNYKGEEYCKKCSTVTPEVLTATNKFASTLIGAKVVSVKIDKVSYEGSSFNPKDKKVYLNELCLEKDGKLYNLYRDDWAILFYDRNTD